MRCFAYTVSDPQGLHARNAISLCRLAGMFKSHSIVRILDEEQQREANCKDMMALMGLRVHQNSRIEICVEGEDETEALEHLAAVIPTIL